VAHSEADAQPRRGVIYRCHVCRLELILDTSGERLTVAPMLDERDDDRRASKL
jgi:hypothetical protein